MSKVYYLKWYDDVVGVILYPECIFKLDKSFNKQFPISLFAGNPTPDSKEVLRFLKGQVIQENNQGINIVMGDLKYPVYDLSVLLDATCGMTLDNAFWLLPKEKLHWDFNTYHIKANPSAWIGTVEKDGSITPPLIKDARDF
ncbi:MAG: hypothetical protein ACLR3R_19790 [Clostridium paraputrificum]